MEKQTNIVTLTGIMTTIFIALKLAKVIDWSWWLVLAPSLIKIVVTTILLAIIGIGVIIESKK